VADPESGEEYLVKDGIEGKTVSEFVDDASASRFDDTLKQSASETLAAAYFSGNHDLHAGNAVVTPDNEVVVIDHDAGGYEQDRFNMTSNDDDVVFMRKFITGFRGGQDIHDSSMVVENIFEKAEQVSSGDIDTTQFESPFEEYMIDAAKNALLRAYYADDYTIDADAMPEQLQTLPDGIDSVDDIDEGDIVEVLREPDESDFRQNVSEQTYEVMEIEDDVIQLQTPGTDTNRELPIDELTQIVDVV